MKISTANMIPLKKPLRAWWVGEKPTGGDSYIEEQTLKAGTLIGYFQWENVGRKLTVMAFTAMIDPGIFNRYRVHIFEEGDNGKG